MRGSYFIAVLTVAVFAALLIAISPPGAAEECSPLFVVYGYLYHAVQQVPVDGGYTIVVQNHTKNTACSAPVGTGFDRGKFSVVFLLGFEPCAVDAGDNISVSVDSLSPAPPPGAREDLGGPVYHIVTSDDIIAMKVQIDATLPMPAVDVQGQTWGAIKNLFRRR